MVKSVLHVPKIVIVAVIVIVVIVVLVLNLEGTGKAIATSSFDLASATRDAILLTISYIPVSTSIPRPLGDACSSDNQCQSLLCGVYHVDSIPGSPNIASKCEALNLNGETCERDIECRSGLCITQFNPSILRSGLSHVGLKVCKASKNKAGQPCLSSSDCISGICSQAFMRRTCN